MLAGRKGEKYLAALTASGGTEPYTWSLIDGELPPGLTLSSAGVLSGQLVIRGIWESETFEIFHGII